MIPITLAGIFNEWAWVLILGVVALMFFGKRLPEMGKSLGRGIVEFKKGLAGVEDEIKKPATPTDSNQHMIEASVTKTVTMTSPPPQDLQGQLRLAQEQLRQLNEQLEATRAQIEQLKKPADKP